MTSIAALEHANVVRALDAGSEGPWHYLVMEFLDGIDVSQLARRVPDLSVGHACEIIRQAALGLSAIHDAGMIHRDIKPSNVFLTRDGTVKLLDLGLVMDGDSPLTGDERLTTVGHLMGTIPTCHESNFTTRGRSDLRRICIASAQRYTVCWRGGLPWENAENLPRTIHKISSQDCPSIVQFRKDLPSGLVDLLGRLLDHNTQQRPATAADVAEELSPFCQQDGLDRLVAIAENAPDSSHNLQDAGSLLTSRPVSPQDQAASRWSRVGLLALVPLMFLAGIVVTIVTDRGTLEIQSEEEGLEIAVSQGDRIAESLTITGSSRDIRLQSGRYIVTLKGTNADGFEVLPNETVITRGDRQIVRIRRKSGAGKISGLELTGSDDALGLRSVSPGPDVGGPGPGVKAKPNSLGDRANMFPLLLKALSFKPRLPEANIPELNAGTVPYARIEEVEQNGSRGFRVTALGKPIRWFADSNGDKRIDTWEYFKDGIVIYRELDKDANGIADCYEFPQDPDKQYGIDEDEDGSVDHWSDRPTHRQAVARSETSESSESQRNEFSIDFKNQPLGEALQMFAELLGLELEIEESKISDAGIDLDERINLTASSRPVSEILDQLLSGRHLSYLSADGKLEITLENPDYRAIAGVLESKPKHSDFVFDSVSKEDYWRCRWEPLTVSIGSAFNVRGPDGRILRTWLDTDGKEGLDQWSWFHEGREVYRASDTDGDKVADHFVWLNENPIRVESTLKQRLYQGKSYAYWLDVLTRERDNKTLGYAMQAVSLLAESDKEKAAAARRMLLPARRWGSVAWGRPNPQFTGNDSATTEEQRSHWYMADLIDCYKPLFPLAGMEAIADELRDGTEKSAIACIMLMSIAVPDGRKPTLANLSRAGHLKLLERIEEGLKQRVDKMQAHLDEIDNARNQRAAELRIASEMAIQLRVDIASLGDPTSKIDLQSDPQFVRWARSKLEAVSEAAKAPRATYSGAPGIVAQLSAQQAVAIYNALGDDLGEGDLATVTTGLLYGSHPEIKDDVLETFQRLISREERKSQCAEAILKFVLDSGYQGGMDSSAGADPTYTDLIRSAVQIVVRHHPDPLKATMSLIMSDRGLPPGWPQVAVDDVLRGLSKRLKSGTADISDAETIGNIQAAVDKASENRRESSAWKEAKEVLQGLLRNAPANVKY